MLVLARKRGESLVMRVGAVKAVVKVIEVLGNRVTLGVDAPPAIKIWREEVDVLRECRDMASRK